MLPSRRATTADDDNVPTTANCSTALMGPLPSPSAGPTLLPNPVAFMVSAFSKSTSASIRLGTFLGSAFLESAKAGTLTSLEISRAAVEGVVRRGSKDVVMIRSKGREREEVEGWATKGMDMFNSSVSLAELLLSTAFELGQTTLTTVSGFAEAYINTVDAVFGSTETSRAINEIVKLIRQEFKEKSEDDGEVGTKDIVTGLTCFAILQYRTRARFDQVFSGNLMWDVVVDADATPAPSDSDETAKQQDETGDIVPVGEGAESDAIPQVLLDKLPQNAEISISTTSTSKSTTAIEVVGTSPPDFTPPPGSVVISESSHHDGRQRYRIVYETVTTNQHCRRLKREDGGDVELIEDNANHGLGPQLFELEDTDSADDRASAYKPICRDFAASETRPPIPPQVRHRSSSSPGKYEDVSALIGANQQRKHAPTVSERRAKEKKEKDVEKYAGEDREKEKGKSKKGKLRRVLVPSAIPVAKERKRASEPHIRVDTSSPKHATSSANLQGSPSLGRNTPAVSHPTSPVFSRSRHHHRTASYSSNAADTFSSRHNSASLRPPSPSSALSIYTQDGEAISRPPSAGGGLRSAPSIYTLHTSLSTSSLHMMYHSPSPGHHGSYFPPQPHILQNFRKYIRFAAASYGAQFMRFLLGSAFAPMTAAERQHHLEHQAFSFHTSLPVDTILLSSHYDPSGGFDSAGQTGTGRPLVHFVCVDHDASSIVVTCRGTLGLEDVLTDLSCEYTSIAIRGQSYRVHKGMYNSATLLLRSKLRYSLASALDAYPDYGLVLTGHSLGAGVAALVSILIAAPSESGTFVTAHPNLPAGRRVHCYAYGSPAAVCESLRRQTRGLVTTIVNGMDVVPCLSIGMVRDLHSVALSFREDTGDVLKEVRRRFVKSFWGRSSAETIRDEEFAWELAVLKTLRAGMTAEKLVPPGEVWCVRYHEKGMNKKVRVTAGVVEDVEGRFGELRLCRGVIGDHSPAGYERTLEALVRGVCGGED